MVTTHSSALNCTESACACVRVCACVRAHAGLNYGVFLVFLLLDQVNSNVQVREMDRNILMAPFQKIREPTLYFDSKRRRQPRGLGVWGIDALQCDSNQNDEGDEVGRDGRG